MNLLEMFNSARPILHFVGTLVMVIGLAKFFGVNIPLGYPALEFAVAGWLFRQI